MARVVRHCIYWWSILAASCLLALLCGWPGANAQDPLAAVDEQLRAILEKHADAKQQIAITFTNNGYMDHY